jgi:hypothetical protein
MNSQIKPVVSEIAKVSKTNIGTDIIFISDPNYFVYNFDLDSSKYFAKVNYTISYPNKILIDKFVLELKANNLWNDTVCWLLLPSQNNFENGYVYALGGLSGYHDGELKGRYELTPQGIYFSQTGYIETSSVALMGTSSRSFFVITENDTNNGFLCGEGNVGSYKPFCIKQVNFNQIQGDFWFGYSNSVLKSKAVGCSYDYRNNVTTWSLSGSNKTTLPSLSTTSGPFYINQAHKDYIYERAGGTFKFVLKSSQFFNKAKFDKLYNIYQNTLGKISSEGTVSDIQFVRTSSMWITIN